MGMPLTICKTQAHKLKSSNSIHVENCYFNSGRLAGLVHYRERDTGYPSGAFLISVCWKRVELCWADLAKEQASFKEKSH